MILNEWAELPGEFTIEMSDSHADWFTRDVTVVRVTHRISPTMRIAAMQPVSGELIRSGPQGVIETHVLQSMDRYFRPWLYPRRTPWPDFDPFPTWTRVAAWVNRRRQRRQA